MHVPVLLQEMVLMLRPRAGGIYLDGTLGAGGYSKAILEHSAPDGRVWAFDLDPKAVRTAAERLESFGERFKAVHGGFHEARSILAGFGVHAVDGAVLDLGLSSEELDDVDRGFSFRWNGPLDMRFDSDSGETARDYLRRISARKLEEILATYGEERYCNKLARGIVAARDRLETTADLVHVVERLLGKRRGKIHPATRTFQALRIAVNREMENLAGSLEEIPSLLKAGGRFCVVSYHSLEDRQVKQSFLKRKREPRQWLLITRKPIRPSSDEIMTNPRSRSARMRVLEAVGGVS